MSTVIPRSHTDFVISRVITEKVVDRVLGYESKAPPAGWKWDQRYVTNATTPERLPNPGVKKSHLLGLGAPYWQNGPLTGRLGNELKVNKIESVFAQDRERWVPEISPGGVNIFRLSDYLFSDNSVVESVDWDLVDGSGRSLHTCLKETRPNSPIRVCIYKRENGEILPWRNYIHRTHFTGLRINDVESTTVDGDTIYWANVDTTRREFVISRSGDRTTLIFNKFVGEEVTWVEPICISGCELEELYPLGDFDDLNDLDPLGDTDGSESQVFYSKYFPICNDWTFEAYLVDVGDLTVAPIQLTAVDYQEDFTGPNQVRVDYDTGTLTLGDGAGSNPVQEAGLAFYLRYRVTPRVEYEEQEEGLDGVYKAVSADVSPMCKSLNRGFVVLSRTEIDIAEISLETTEPLYSGSVRSYGPIYVGSDYANLVATVRNSSGETVPNVEVTFYFVTDPSVGNLGGSGSTTQRRTSYDGKARTYYTPPVSVDSMGFYVKTVGSGNSLVLPAGANFGSPLDIYTYLVLKDDPLTGKVGADEEAGEVMWSPSLLNGRKAIYYKYDISAINPISGLAGAYVPVRPTLVSAGNTLYYADTLDVPDPGMSSINLGAYWVASDRYITLRASAYSPRERKTIYSNLLTLRVSIPEYMKGSYISQILQEIPFGWRLPDANYEIASALSGATFISINPIAGPYPIIDVISGESWTTIGGYSGSDEAFWPYGAYPYGGTDEVVTHPFARMALFWNIET